MREAFFVFLGGGIGSVLRYWTILAVHRWLPAGVFPLGVFTANVLGSFTLGFLFALPIMRSRDHLAWLFMATGVLGGYTTFSTLANDSWQLLLGNQPWVALLNTAGSIIAGTAAAALGWGLARHVWP